MAAVKKQVLALPNIDIRTVEIVLKGNNELMLGKMTDRQRTSLIKSQTGVEDKTKVKEPINMYENIMSSIYWMNGKETNYTEEGWHKAMQTNRIGYSAEGIKKGMLEAVVRIFGKSKSTVENANIMILSENNLCPVTFESYDYDESIITSFNGTFVTYRPILRDWRCTVKLQFIENNITIQDIANIFTAMGFAGGLGARRVGLKGGSYGSFYVEDIRDVEDIPSPFKMGKTA